MINKSKSLFVKMMPLKSQQKTVRSDLEYKTFHGNKKERKSL